MSSTETNVVLSRDELKKLSPEVAEWLLEKIEDAVLNSEAETAQNVSLSFALSPATVFLLTARAGKKTKAVKEKKTKAK